MSALLSTGESGESSYFVNASADGTSVFMITSSQLVPADEDDSPMFTTFEKMAAWLRSTRALLNRAVRAKRAGARLRPCRRRSSG